MVWAAGIHFYWLTQEIRIRLQQIKDGAHLRTQHSSGDNVWKFYLTDTKTEVLRQYRRKTFAILRHMHIKRDYKFNKRYD